jgi:hypothetical protein
MADRENLESVRLDESAARRLIERATELDARLASESTVADLRDAARSAGISDEAFNRALREVRQEAQPTLVPVDPSLSTPGMKRRVVLAIVAAVLLAAGLALFGRTVPSPVERHAQPTPAAAPSAVPTPAPAPPEGQKTTPKTKVR